MAPIRHQSSEHYKANTMLRAKSLPNGIARPVTAKASAMEISESFMVGERGFVVSGLEELEVGVSNDSELESRN